MKDKFRNLSPSFYLEYQWANNYTSNLRNYLYHSLYGNMIIFIIVMNK